MLATRHPFLTFMLTGVFTAVMVAGQGFHLLVEASRSDEATCHSCCPRVGGGHVGTPAGHASPTSHDSVHDRRAGHHDPSLCAICQFFANGNAVRTAALAVWTPSCIFDRPCLASNAAPQAVPAAYDARGPPLV